ncbi:MAG: efflux RND transporter periplasmic adaptor subunit [Alphaproteobacteria bacterium]|nr:efflux RND transporter periplasmic adaptor subunit [Alphaproteobacteria bacterium]
MPAPSHRTDLSHRRARRGVSAAKVLVPIVLILGGIGIAVALIKFRPEVEQGDAAAVSLPVEVTPVHAAGTAAVVRGTGTVVADQQVALTPQVGGKLVFVSDQLRPGGRFGQGDVIARVEARDYQLAVTQAKSQVESARLNVELERSRGAVAEKEWKLVSDGAAVDQAPALARRAPQLASAEAALAAAEAQLETAELNLARTSLRAPFNAMVVSENVDVGQVIGATTQVATLVGTDTLRVDVQVPVQHLPLLSIPGMGGGEDGSSATVVQRLTEGGAGSARIERTGHVVGLGGQLDPATRTATVIVEIRDPVVDGQLPLLPGAYVDVALGGGLTAPALAVPRDGVRDGEIAWVVADGKLARRQLDVAWRDDDFLYASGGISEGEPVVVSALSLPIEGTAVDVIGTKDRAAAEEAE